MNMPVLPVDAEWISNVVRRTRQAGPSENGRDKRVPPKRIKQTHLLAHKQQKGRRSTDRRPGSEEGRQFSGGYWVIPSFSSSSSAMMMRGVTIIIRLWVSRPTPTFLNNRFT